MRQIVLNIPDRYYGGDELVEFINAMSKIGAKVANISHYNMTSRFIAEKSMQKNELEFLELASSLESGATLIKRDILRHYRLSAKRIAELVEIADCVLDQRSFPWLIRKL